MLRRAIVLLAALGSLLAQPGCGNGEGRKKAVECQVDDDCDDSKLGVCDTVSCESNKCVVGHKPDGKKCDDNDPLTGKDACLTGVCSGVAKTCDDSLDPCLKAVHDPMTDECTVEPADDGTPCDDKNACTQADTCKAGECVGGDAKTCAAADDCHVDGECDPDTGACNSVAADDGTSCDDGQACTSNDACKDGVCGGEAVVCDDGLACSVDSCDKKSGACQADMSKCACVTDADCDDHNACNGTEICSPTDKVCQLGTPVVCPTSVDPCLSNVCVPETGECDAEPVKDGTTCDDQNACTQTDKCQAGACVGSDAVVCAALGQCYMPGVCDKVTGACSNPEKPATSPCNDGNACTQTDTCLAGACVGSAATTCKAADQCHVAGVCDTQTGICSNPAKQDGLKCSDGSPCSTGDRCLAGACVPTAQVVCVAQDSCHDVGTCDAKTGLCSNPAKLDGSVCGDGLTCTTPDTCSGGKCVGTPVKCDDGIACTVDSCSEQLGGCTVNTSACGCKTSQDCDDGNPCNGAETCNPKTLQCVSGKAVDCSALDDACNVGACSPATGTCAPSPKANGTLCDDGDKCTQASSCQAGACKGSSPIVCTASDQCHDAGVCNSATGACSNPAKANNSLCNDGNACTQTDTCQSGVCTGASAIVCGASDQCHTAGVCDPSSGACSNPAKKNGSTCDDTDACTQTDTCQGGSCVGASPVTCTASDQCHSAGTCDSKTGTCSNPAKKDGSGCDDGNACTQTDTCQTGTCTGAKPVVCSASDQCHTAGTCDSKSGACSNPVKAGSCDDGNACTQTDTCVSGVCTGSKPVVCTASDQCHDVGTCDSKSGACSNPSKLDGTLCNDGKTCTNGDKCTAGVCGGGAITCDDKIACTVDSCVEPTGCTSDHSKCQCAKDADCNDNNACNGVEKCDMTTLSCVAGTAVSCSNLDDQCNVGVCNTMTGACSASPRPDTTGCDDGNACTKSDSCLKGKCTGSSPVVCSASDQCHDAGTCDTKTGVCSNPNHTGSCDDGNKCTQTDTCQAGVCTGTNPVVCSASDQCHLAGSCDTSTGTCSNPVKTGSCDDGDACTQTDTCQAGVCKGGNPVVCSASDQCHDVGTCDSKSGACSNPAKKDTSPCDDGNKCTQSDACMAGKCTGSNPVTCSALGQCYVAGTCDTQTGVCSNPFASNTTKCDDSDACTTGELCDGAGNCGGGGAVVCPPPSNVCLVASCNSALGCVTSPQNRGFPCDDGSQCTRSDTCSGKGTCIGSNTRVNANSDWSDDPGPTIDSIHVFSDIKANANVVGLFHNVIGFDDKDDATGGQGQLDAARDKVATGIYWARYAEDGTFISSLNIGGAGLDVNGVPISVTVAAAAGHRDGTFTLVGTIGGPTAFGPPASRKTLNVNVTTVYVAHYAATGDLAWVAPIIQDPKETYSVSAVAAFDDESVIASGFVSTGGQGFFNDVNGKPFAQDGRAGVWAVVLDSKGVGKWGRIVVQQIAGAVTPTAIAAHEDNSASLVGWYANHIALGPKNEIDEVTTGGRVDRDAWFEKLDSGGALLWGGRVGGSGLDLAIDVARVQGGGIVMLTDTHGRGVSGNDAKTTQPFYSTVTTGYQAHVTSIDTDGIMQNDALIANPEAGDTIGYQLKKDLKDFYAVGGTFSNSANFYGSIRFGTGSPPGGLQHTVNNVNGGTPTLFAARVDPKPQFDWAVQAGGDGGGLGAVKMAAHPSHSITLAGMFDTNAIFGDQVTELLTMGPAAAPVPPNAFVVHLNSQAEYDYCP